MIAPLIIVVDDDAAYTSMITDILTHEGYRVLCCRNGREGYAAIQHARPALILLDVRMENAHAGWLLLEMLRLNAITASIPVIMASASKEFLQQKESQIRRRATDILVKPFGLDELLQKITALLTSSISNTISERRAGESFTSADPY